MGPEITPIDGGPDTVEARHRVVPVAMEERPRCPVCDSLTRDVVWAGRFRDADVRAFLDDHRYAGDPLGELGDERFELVRCRGCDMRYHARVLDAAGLSRLYATWIDGAQIERFEAAHGRESRFAVGRQLVKHVLRMHALAGHGEHMKVLDFGCGDGRTLRVVDALGLQAIGVDASATRMERAARAGLSVHPTLEAALGEAGGSVDAIVMSEVIEHLVAPRPVLESLVAALRPGGVILIEAPDARGIDGAPKGFEQMRVVHPLEHVNAFTPKTLETLARRVGLEPARRVPAHATTRAADLLRTELAGLIARPTTSRYFVRR
jgi:2-polyprenyl-3-methyl-5-hydroxy-6-metoxy-1,4-benzoquinol methylase